METSSFFFKFLPIMSEKKMNDIGGNSKNDSFLYLFYFYYNYFVNSFF